MLRSSVLTALFSSWALSTALSGCSDTATTSGGAGGSSAAVGATSSVGSQPSGGSESPGGATNTGGTKSMGGTTNLAGSANTGGTTNSAGSSDPGGSTNIGGSQPTSGSTGVAGSVNTGGSSSGDTITWQASDYASRKWARWPIPNPKSLGLPRPMSFMETADGVLDQVTGLLWEKPQSSQTMTWQAALDYCTQKGNGWSLPTRIELTSIVDNTQSGVKAGSPLLTFQPKAGWTWASTPWVVNSRKTVNPPLSWFINLSQGDSNNSLSQLAASAYARCVRIPTTQQLPREHYTVANGEVRDNYTGLSWHQPGSGTTPSFSAAQATSYCDSLAVNGRTWRLPSLNELASAVDDVPSGNVSPAVDHAAFPALSKDQWYWSASPHGASTTEQWMLNFMDGFTKHQPVATLGLALCVHD